MLFRSKRLTLQRRLLQVTRLNVKQKSLELSVKRQLKRQTLSLKPRLKRRKSSLKLKLKLKRSDATHKVKQMLFTQRWKRKRAVLEPFLPLKQTVLLKLFKQQAVILTKLQD